MSKVFIVKCKGAIDSSGKISASILQKIFERGFCRVSARPNIKDSLLSLFRRGETVGIKINTLGGPKISTRPEVSLSLASLISKHVSPAENTIIWDRTNWELRDSGYRLNKSGKGIKVFGTDTQGIDYTPDLVSHLNIGSRFSYIQSRLISSSISLAVLKDHGLAGITAGMKNYFGAIHNPNKYHDTNCNPYVAELFDSRLIKSKHRISILDALTTQFHRGPSFHPQWAKKTHCLIFSLDPVAADAVGWQMIEQLRSEKGLPSLKEEGREPLYLKTAEGMNLGRANIQDIEIIQEEI